MTTAESLISAQMRVQQRALAEPHAIAVVDPVGRSFSYQMLLERSQQLAGKLAKNRIGTEAIVLVSLEPGLDAVAALLGTLLSGAAYLPLDPGTPHRRIQEVIERSGASAVIGEQSGSDFGSRVLYLPPDDWAETEFTAALFEPAAIHPQQLAYVIFTSGSTGVPKGVMMPHAGLSRLIDWQCASTPGPLRTLAFAPVGFDVSLQEVLSTLASGSTLFLCEEATRRDPGRLLDVLLRHPIERLFLTPTSLHRLAEVAQQRGVWSTALRHVIAAGEPLVTTAAIARLFERMPGARLDNHYGPTEAHLVTCHSLDGPTANWPDRVPIGLPVDGMTAHSIDPGGQQASVDGGSELFAGGIGVARGYLGDPAATALRFVPDPLASTPGAVAYQTGDVVRRLSDETLSFHGRVDRQIKVRGFRVEPAEVERQLCALEEIAEAAVDLRDVAEGVTVLVAYYVAKATTPTERSLAERLAEGLPSYMVPARFIPIAALPRTSSGKIDRNALQAVALDEQADLEEAGSVSAIDTVRRIWQRVLGHTDFEDDEDFFDVGGDSLLAAWVVAELSRISDREITLAAFLDAGTVAALVEAHNVAPDHSVQQGCGAELVTLRQGTPGRLLFLVHPLGGELLTYRHFARTLTIPVRVIGLRLTGNWHETSFDFTAMAASHIAEIRSIEPQGPYRLAGWSFGGALAYEIARQLREAGETVSFLGMIDANPELDPLSGKRNHDVKYLPAIDAAIAALARGESGSALFGADGIVVELLGGAIPDAMPLAELSRYLATTRGCLAAAQEYQPQAIDAAVDLFQAARSAPDLKRSLYEALHRLAGRGLSLHEVDADHFSMMRQPAVADLAQAFDGALRHALAGEQELI